MNKIALITGATAGIGKATALLLAENNFDILITGRRKERLDELKKHISEKFNVEAYALNFDVRDSNQVDKAFKSLPDKWKNIDVLINNAGLAAGFGAIQENTVDDWNQMIDTNIKGLLYVSRKVFPVMIQRKQGHIVNIGSVAGKEVYLNGSVYCATKHAVDALSKGMRIDMLPYGVKVTQISPGLVETEFSMVRFKGDQEKADKVYENMQALTAEDIADNVLYAITRPAHVNINDIWVMPTAQANTTHTLRKE